MNLFFHFYLVSNCCTFWNWNYQLKHTHQKHRLQSATLSTLQTTTNKILLDLHLECTAMNDRCDTFQQNSHFKLWNVGSSRWFNVTDKWFTRLSWHIQRILTERWCEYFWWSLLKFSNWTYNLNLNSINYCVEGIHFDSLIINAPATERKRW